MAQRVYTSRLLGQDPCLVLHGGGNTSVKACHTTVFGEELDVLVVKGSGSDLADIDTSGFATLRLEHVARLATLDHLTDTEMARQLDLAAVVPGGPAPSVEAILHAVLPHRFVDHTHADAVVTLTNTPAGEALVKEVFGHRVAVVPYVMPGFQLARLCAQQVAAGAVDGPGVVGLVLLNHGIFTWGATARESYERMIELVNLAADHLERVRVRARAATALPVPSPAGGHTGRAAMRAAVAEAAGAPVVISWHTDAPVMAFLGRPDLADVSQRGPATPDHVIRTKRVPMMGRDVGAYTSAYRAYFEGHRHRSTAELQPLDPAPRVVLDPELGMGCVGRSPADAAIAEDIYRHTMQVIADATELGGYQPVSPADLFDVEYWDLEQAKLRGRGAPLPHTGEVALVTGAASGIGRACAAALMAEGAAVVGLDLSPAVMTTFAGRPPAHHWLGIHADVTGTASVAGALDEAVARFGGLDILVLNAGIFPASSPIADLDPDSWRQVMAVNLDANARLLKEAHPLLRLSPGGGRVVVIGSKNVPAPGPGAAAYSASKAALTQLARVAALEWGPDRIHVNVVHPNAVFDTGVWTEEVLSSRAASYGLSVEEYRRANLLGTEVTSADVARMCVAMCGPAFARTTGAQVPVDGGNLRVV